MLLAILSGAVSYPVCAYEASESASVEVLAYVLYLGGACRPVIDHYSVSIPALKSKERTISSSSLDSCATASLSSRTTCGGA